MVQEAFDIADQYRNPCLLLIDGLIGQMMEPIEWHEIKRRDLPPKDWATTGRHGRDHHNIINSLYIDPVECNNFNTELQKKFQIMKENECRWEERDCDDAEVVLVAYGTPARISLSAMELMREHGIKAGLFRPKTVWPYPYDALRKIADQDSVKKFLVVEMSEGQMIQDVQLAVQDRKPIEFLGHAGGVMPTVEEIAEKAMEGLK